MREHPLSARTIGSAVVVAGYVVVLAVAGRPVWLAVLLGLVLLSVWVAPLMLSPPRRGTAPRRTVVGRTVVR